MKAFRQYEKKITGDVSGIPGTDLVLVELSEAGSFMIEKSRWKSQQKKITDLDSLSSAFGFEDRFYLFPDGFLQFYLGGGLWRRHEGEPEERAVELTKPISVRSLPTWTGEPGHHESTHQVLGVEVRIGRAQEAFREGPPRFERRDREEQGPHELGHLRVPSALRRDPVPPG